MNLDAKQAAGVLRTVADLLEVHGESEHRVRAFARASRAVDRLGDDLGAMVADGRILSVPGIGRSIAAALSDLAAGYRPAILCDLEARTPAGLSELFRVSGLGPKRVRTLWRELGVTSLGELEYACLENRLAELAGFGRSTQSRVLESVRFLARADERRLVDRAWKAAEDLAGLLRAVDGVDQVEVTGELRRGAETVEAVELVVAGAADGNVVDLLRQRLEELREESAGVWAGRDRAAVPCRVRVVDPRRFVAALVWSTGSPAHLEELTARAADRGYGLAKDGLWRGGEQVLVEDEEGLYRALGCDHVPPELREGEGELERAARGTLPELVRLEDLRGTLHNHTTDSDGRSSLEDMGAAAEALGWEYLGLADHSPAAFYANGLSCERLRDQWQRVQAWNRGSTGLRMVRGLEADILTDGALDIPAGCRDELEYVVASVHSSFRLSREAQTERLLSAVRDPSSSILGHPTGRLLLARQGYAVDLEAVLAACAEHGVAVEINASPYRLDLDWRWARRALELGVCLAINPDAHEAQGLGDVRWGIMVARKAGARAEEVLNTRGADELLELLRARSGSRR